MDIEAIVTKYERLIPAGAYTLAEGIRAAMMELAAEYEERLGTMGDNLTELAVERDNLEERIRQLEAERVPEGWSLVPMEPTPRMCWAAVAEYELATGDRLPDADGHDYAVVARLFRAMLAAAPKKEGE